MANRTGRWDLLGHDADPITTRPDDVDTLAKYYADMAEDVRISAMNLKPVGDDDTSVAEGLSVDAVRGRAKDVTNSLNQLHGRYQSAADAFRGFHADVGLESDRGGEGTVMAVSWAALEAAEAADSELTQAQGSADPAQAAKDAGKEPTPQDLDDSGRRAAAIDTQKSALSGARAKLEQAQGMLAAAGQRAAATMKSSWKDGLHDSGWYKFLHGLIKFFTIIGMILAVLAFFIPGLGLAAIVGAIGAAFSLVAAGLKFATGEGSIFEIVMAAIGILTLGIGSRVTAITNKAVSGMVKTVGPAMLKDANALAEKALTSVSKIRHDAFDDFLKGNKDLKDTLEHIDTASKAAKQPVDTAITRLEDFSAKFKANPNWWDLKNIKTTYGLDRSTVTTQWADKFTTAGLKSWGERFAGIDFQVLRNEMDTFLRAAGYGGPGRASGWHFASGLFGSALGRGSSIALPIVFGTDFGDHRPWEGWTSGHKGAYPDVHV